jgi:hypothetical protein
MILVKQYVDGPAVSAPQPGTISGLIAGPRGFPAKHQARHFLISAALLSTPGRAHPARPQQASPPGRQTAGHWDR